MRQEQQQQQEELDASEVYFLVLHWLSSGPCQEAARALLQDVEQHRLFPSSCSLTGSNQPQRFQQLLQQHRSVPPTALPQLLQQSLARVRQSGYPGAEGITTLLAEGPLAALPSLQQPAGPHVPLWIRRPAQAPSLPQQLLLRQAGQHSGLSSWRLPLRVMARRFCHHATFRGHGFPVFCVVFDKDGRRVVTGADDGAIKVWSLQTGLLLVSARGHTGEVSDLALSCDGALLASGATDGEVRVWSMQDVNLGQNLAVLRGHRAPINQLAFHPSVPTALLSASSDGTLRLWDASDQHHAAFVLRAAQAAAGEAEDAAAAVGAEASGAYGPGLRAAADDTAAAAGHAGRGPGAVLGLRQQPLLEDDASSMVTCAWSPDGTLIAAGCTDGSLYMWQWSASTPDARPQPAPAGLSQQQQRQLRAQQGLQEAVQQGGKQQQLQADAARAARATAEPLQAADWPQPLPFPELKPQGSSQGSEGVWLVEFSHDGSRLAIGSQDGPIRVWSCASPLTSWQENGKPLLLSPVPGAAAAAAAAAAIPRQRQRRVVPEKGLTLHRVAWTADDSKLLAAASDHIIRVWDSQEWSLLHAMPGHRDKVYVLSAHPTDGRLALSAGYDGLSILWDVEAGTELCRFSSSDTPPLARGSWAPPIIQVVEGRFSSDGTAFVVSDVAGQFSLYGLGPPSPVLLAAPYDQFFERDYDQLVYDTAGFAAYADPSTGVVVTPVWQAARQYAAGQQPALQQPLCDNHFRPYPPDFQAAYRAGRVLEYVLAGRGNMCLRGSSMSLPPSLQQWPPTITAAEWKALEDRAILAARRTSVPSEEATRDAAERSALEQHNRLLAALARGMTLQEHAQAVALLEQERGPAATQAHGQGQQPQQLQQQQQQHEAEQAGRGAAAVAAAAGATDRQQEQQPAGAGGPDAAQGAVPTGQHLGEMDFALNFFPDDEEDVFDELHDLDAAPDSNDSDYSAPSEQQEGSSEDLNDGGSGSSLGSGSEDSGGGRGGRRRISQRQQQQRQRRHARRQQAAADGDGGRHNLRPRRGGRAASSQPEDEIQGATTRSRRQLRSTASAQDLTAPEQQQQQQRTTPESGRPTRKRRHSWSQSSTPEEDNDSSRGAQRRQQQQQQQRRRRTRQRLDAAAAAAEGSPQCGIARRGRGGDAGPLPLPAAAAAAAAAGGSGGEDALGVTNPLAAWRPESCYSWLSSDQQTPGVYVPQLGDAVVYVRRDHKELLDRQLDVQSSRPWETFQQLGLGAWQQQQQQELTQQHAWQHHMQHGSQQHGQDIPQQQQQSYDPRGMHESRQQQQQGQEQEPAPPASQHTAAAAAGAGYWHAAGGVDAAAASAAATIAAAAAAGGGWDGGDGGAAAFGGQQGVWQQPPAAVGPFQLRAVEPCLVVGLEYVFLPGDVTGARLTLQLSDPTALTAVAAAAAGTDRAADPAAAAAAAAQGCFQVVLPPPGPGIRPFVVLQSHFAAAVSRAWRAGDAVQVSSACEDGSDGSCWRQGVITAVAGSTLEAARPDDATQPQRLEQPVLDPYNDNSLWRRYQVCWSNSNTAGSSQQAAAVAAAAAAVADAVEPLAQQHPGPAGAVVGASAEQSGHNQQQEEAAAAGAPDEQQQHPQLQPGATAVGSMTASAPPGAAAAGQLQADAAAAAAAPGPAPAAAAAGHAAAAWLSPWELYPAGQSPDDAVAAEHAAGIDAEQVAHLLHTVERLRARQFKFFGAPPSPDARFSSKAGVRAYNRIIPLPLGLSNIQARLQAGYYRSMQALLHDAALIASNAAEFNGQDSPFAAKSLQLYNALLLAAYPQQQQQQLGEQQGQGSAEWLAGQYGQDWQQQQQQLAGSWFDAGAAPTGMYSSLALQQQGGWQQYSQQVQQQQGPSAGGTGIDAFAAGQQHGWASAAAAWTSGQQQQQQLSGLRPRAPAHAAGARRSGRHVHPQQQQHEGARARRSVRSAAQQARAFMADYAAVARVGSSDSNSQPGLDDDGPASDTDSGSQGTGRRGGRVRAGPVRHSARLQEQGGRRRPQYSLSEGSDGDLDGFSEGM